MGRAKKENFYKDFIPCSICGLPIPPGIARIGHPLSGSIDHIVPRSKGGTDTPSNRAPAHYFCNTHKGSRDITLELREMCWAEVLRVGMFYFTSKQISKGKARMAEWKLQEKERELDIAS